MARTPLVLALILLLAPLAGCFSEDAVPVQTETVAASAAQAGAVDGPAPAAAKNPYQLADAEGGQATTVYPVAIQTNAAKSPFSDTFTGEFQPQTCTPAGGGLPLGGLGLARGSRSFEVSDVFAQHDVFRYDVTLTFTNTDPSWAELHLWNQFDDVGNYWNEPTSENRGETVLNFTGQGFIINDEFFAGVGVDCWFGQVTTPIPFTITVDITFAEGGVPSAQPVLVQVPEGATRLFVTGLATDGSKPVTSHFRLFAPDDSLVCECTLRSDQTSASVELLAGAGDYVLLVDHTENGFVALALDAPSPALLHPLGSRWESILLGASDGGSLDETKQITLNSTPLSLNAWVFAPGDMRGTPDTGVGHNVKISVANARGDVLRMSLVGYLTYHAAVPGAFATSRWYAIPIDGDWEFYQDHHAYDLGAHTVTVHADSVRGVVTLFAQFYDRAS